MVGGGGKGSCVYGALSSSCHSSQACTGEKETGSCRQPCALARTWEMVRGHSTRMAAQDDSRGQEAAQPGQSQDQENKTQIFLPPCFPASVPSSLQAQSLGALCVADANTVSHRQGAVGGLCQASKTQRQCTPIHGSPGTPLGKEAL